MSKAVDARRLKFSPEVTAKMQELARLIGAEKYGGRPPLTADSSKPHSVFSVTLCFHPRRAWRYALR